jgi:cytochrome c-type protein NapC/trimethylamine-N-oxide reductase cytochrome c-type subunit TorC
MSVRKIFKVIKKHIPAFMVGVGFAVLSFIGLNAAMGPTSTSHYCSSKCHEMNTAYQTWELSEHGAGRKGVRVECIDCHLPPKDKFFTHVAAKAYVGGKDIYKHYFGGEYDLENMRKKVLDQMLDERCVNCHNNLLARPSGPAARIAHTASLARPNSPEARCLACHEYAGHQRKSKLFSP